MLRQRSRPYLFSNTLAPPIVATSLKTLDSALQLNRSARSAGVKHAAVPAWNGRAGFHITPASIHLSDHARRRGLATRMAEPCLRRGVYVWDFRIRWCRRQGPHPRTDLAAHTPEDLTSPWKHLWRREKNWEFCDLSLSVGLGSPPRGNLMNDSQPLTRGQWLCWLRLSWAGCSTEWRWACFRW